MRTGDKRGIESPNRPHFGVIRREQLGGRIEQWSGFRQDWKNLGAGLILVEISTND